MLHGRERSHGGKARHISEADAGGVFQALGIPAISRSAMRRYLCTRSGIGQVEAIVQDEKGFFELEGTGMTAWSVI